MAARRDCAASADDDPGGEDPPRSSRCDEPPSTIEPLIASAGSCALVALLALALVPAPRFVAWLALLFASIALGRWVGRQPGVAAAITSGYFYLVAHGRPRFDMHVTDRLTIRMAFALGALGALAVLGASRRPSTLFRFTAAKVGARRV